MNINVLRYENQVVLCLDDKVIQGTKQEAIQLGHAILSNAYAISDDSSHLTPVAADSAEQQRELDAAQASYIPGNVGLHKPPTR